MSERDAFSFVRKVKQNPKLVFDLVRHINGSYITRCDKTPLKILPGHAVEILANNHIGGSISQPVKSRPFPRDFDPNPLF